MLVENGKKEMSIEEKAEFLIAARDFKSAKKQKWSKGTDFLALNAVSDGKVLVRLMERSKSGFIGAEEVKEMAKTMLRMDCGSGFLVGKRFTDAAIAEMSQSNIQHVSDDYMRPVSSENLILVIDNAINDLCKRKCGGVPLKESDCKGQLDRAPCKVRSISDDALFHYGRGWIGLLNNDFRQLLSMKKTVKT